MHGGVSALILDQVLGEAAGAGGKPGMTGTLTLRYRQGTPLGDLRVEGWIDRVDGIKTYAKAHILGPDGVTVEAEGIMILPRWAREAIAKHEGEHAVLLRVTRLRPGPTEPTRPGGATLSCVGEPRLLDGRGLELRADVPPRA